MSFLSRSIRTDARTPDYRRCAAAPASSTRPMADRRMQALCSSVTTSSHDHRACVPYLFPECRSSVCRSPSPRSRPPRSSSTPSSATLLTRTVFRQRSCFSARSCWRPRPLVGTFEGVRPAWRCGPAGARINDDCDGRHEPRRGGVRRDDGARRSLGRRGGRRGASPRVRRSVDGCTGLLGRERSSPWWAAPSPPAPQPLLCAQSAPAGRNRGGGRARVARRRRARKRGGLRRTGSPGPRTLLSSVRSLEAGRAVGKERSVPTRARKAVARCERAHAGRRARRRRRPR